MQLSLSYRPERTHGRLDVGCRLSSSAYLSKHGERTAEDLPIMWQQTYRRLTVTSVTAEGGANGLSAMGARANPNGN